jgi:hypothetical protein
MMIDNTTKEPRLLDLHGFMAALLRAGDRARELAARTHTDLIQVRDGKMERISPTEDVETKAT